jgi:hypothetical protein
VILTDDREAIREYGEELLKIMDEFRAKIKAGTKDPDNFLTISDIEYLWSELKGNASILYSDMLAEILRDIDETDLIRKKKPNFEKKE